MYEIPLEKKPPKPAANSSGYVWGALMLFIAAVELWRWEHYHALTGLGFLCMGIARVASGPGPGVNVTIGEVYRGFRSGRFALPALPARVLGGLGAVLVFYSWYLQWQHR
jgi:hypothetical protein